MKHFIFVTILLLSCSEKASHDTTLPIIQYDVETEQTLTDTDDPAIWYNKKEPSKSLVIGTDKDDVNAGVYAFNLEGKIVNKSLGFKRFNNVDIEYGFVHGEDTIDIAIATERGTNKIRIFNLPELNVIDNGGLEVFEGETERSPMGVAIYKKGNDVYVIVGRKSGPSKTYLWQYELRSISGKITSTLVRKFGEFSGSKEIEAICVDDELGYIYYSDEKVGIRKYYADPHKGNEELALFGTRGFKSDHEGISIYKTGKQTGYIIVSDQQSNTFHFFPREGSKSNQHSHNLIVELPVSTNESDGSDVIHYPLNSTFDTGMFVAMSDNKTFQFFSWDKFSKYLKK